MSIREKQSRNIKEALAKSDKRIGRPRTVNYDAVRSLRKSGLSIAKIADKLNSSRGAVENALKAKP